VNRGDVDDSAPPGLLHVRECGFGEVESRGEVESDDLFPLGVGEVDALVDVLHACVVDQHVHPSEIFHCVFHELLAVGGLGEVCEDELGLNVGVFLCEVRLGVLDFLLRGEAVEDDVVSAGSEGVSDAEADAAERASHDGNIIVFPE